MNIYEYRAKEILKKYGVKVPKGNIASDPLSAEFIAKEIGGRGWGTETDE